MAAYRGTQSHTTPGGCRRDPGDSLQQFCRIAAPLAGGQPLNAQVFARALGDLSCDGYPTRINQATLTFDLGGVHQEFIVDHSTHVFATV